MSSLDQILRNLINTFTHKERLIQVSVHTIEKNADIDIHKIAINQTSVVGDAYGIEKNQQTNKNKKGP